MGQFGSLNGLEIPLLRKNCCLLLDFDGTLVEFSDHPQSVVVEPHVRKLLRFLSSKLDGRLAIVSGRALSDLAYFLPDPEFTLVGSYGAEFPACGDSDLHLSVATDPSELNAELDNFKQTHPNVVIETKPFGIALHYRIFPTLEKQCQDFGAALANKFDLALERGDMTVEVRARGCDKGTAVAKLLSRQPHGSGVPVFVGDQRSDEPAFEAVMARGGFGVQVGAACQSVARYRLTGVPEVLEWLQCSLEQLQ